MLKLILDVGNTNIKFGFFDNDKLIKTNIISTKSYSISQLRKNIKNISHTQIYIGSVVKHLNNQMLNDIKTITGISAKFINAKDFISEFDLSKFNINEIGVDILGLSLAIKYLYKKAIGISLGTATFAVAVDNSKLIGAVIAPSIELGINQLNETTALIKTKDFINWKKKSQLRFGNNTNSAISSGASHMANGFIWSVLDYAQKHFKINRTIVSGGKSTYINFLSDSKNIKVVDNAVLIGYNYLINKLFRHK